MKLGKWDIATAGLGVALIVGGAGCILCGAYIYTCLVVYGGILMWAVFSDNYGEVL